jgi:hypothetical protein
VERLGTAAAVVSVAGYGLVAAGGWLVAIGNTIVASVYYVLVACGYGLIAAGRQSERTGRRPRRQTNEKLGKSSRARRVRCARVSPEDRPLGDGRSEGWAAFGRSAFLTVGRPAGARASGLAGARSV